MSTPMTLTRLIESRMSGVARRAAGLSLVAAAAALGGCVDQPKPGCISTTNAFAVKLITVDGPIESAPGACTGLGPETFNALPEIGLSPYYARGSDGQPDYERGSLAVQSAEIGTYFYTAEGFDVGNTSGGNIYSLGDFTSAKPGSDNFCTVPELSPTELVLGALAPVPDDAATEADESFPGQPPVSALLEWSNVRVYVTADIFGTQMDGDLVDTRTTATGDTCTYSYRALGLAPAVSCAATDADGNPTIDESLCEPEADIAAGRPLGSGISPSARFECDPVTRFCLIEGETVPALR